MTMTSLFPNEDALASAMNATVPHVQFKAGLMSHDATTNIVTADPHLIVFPGESVMKRVQSTPARVYVLKWIGADTRMFFWMQGGDDTQDDPIIEEVNRILEFGPQQQSSRIPSLPPQPPIPPPRLRIPETSVTAPVPDAADAAAAAAAAAARAALSVQPAPTTASPGKAAAPATALTLESFGRMLDALPSVANPGAADAARRAMLVQPTIPDFLRSAEFAAAVQTPEVQNVLPSIFEHLPEEERSVEAAAELMRCPQVLTQAAALSRALNAGQGAALLRSLGLEEADGEAVGMKALLDALKKVQRRE